MNLPPIERDEANDRTTIPLPGGWSVEYAKRVASLRDPEGKYRRASSGRVLERMAREIHAAVSTFEEESQRTVDESVRLVQEARQLAVSAQQVPEVLLEARRFIEQRCSEMGYGYYRPKNPHDFTPDPECCTPEEHANHQAACEAFDKGTYVHDRSDGWIGNLHVTIAPWGIGSYVIRDEWADEIMAKIDALAAAPKDQSP